MTILEATLVRPPLIAKPSGPVNLRGLQPLYSQRVGFNIFGSLDHTAESRAERNSHQVSWPLGMLALYLDHLTLGSALRTYRIEYSCVERITRSMLFHTRIDHGAQEVPDVVLMHGWFLLRSLRKAIEENGLRLTIV